MIIAIEPVEPERFESFRLDLIPIIIMITINVIKK